MKKMIKFLAYISFFMMLLTSSMPLFMFIFSDYKSADSLQIYGALLISLIIFIFTIISDMRKLRSIIILSILNLIFLFIPGTIFYLCIVYGAEFIQNSFNTVIYTSYITYALNYPTTSAISSWIGPTFFINLVIIFISLLWYLNESESKDNI